jgi:hypothetical protein
MVVWNTWIRKTRGTFMKCTTLVRSGISMTLLLVLTSMTAFGQVAGQGAVMPPPVAPPVPTLPPPPPHVSVPVRSSIVHLRVDGNLFGRISLFASTGNLVPAKATIHFVQNGHEVFTTQSDERGNFQAVGLRPGVYSVIAMGADGFTAFSVLVLPYDPAIPEDELLLQGTLIPPADMALLTQMFSATPVPVTTPPMAVGPMGGGGGGGAGFRGFALGGLAGLAGLAGLGGEEKPATPFQIRLPDKNND